MKTHGISRRDLFKAAGIGAGALAVGSRFGGVTVARAQDATAAAFYNFAVGDLAVTVIQEGKTTLPTSFFGANVGETVAADLLTERGIPLRADGNFVATINVALVRSGERLVLIDTGLGDVPFPGAVGNLLLPTLESIGVTAEAITDVIITHHHADHVGGLSTMEGTPLFTNAVVHMPDVELDFVQNAPPTDQQAGTALLKSSGYLASEQIATYATDAEILPGISAIFTPGHTPGHVSLRLSSGDAQVVATADVANHPILALANPDWSFAFDADPALASESRRALFGMLADDQTPVFVYHFPFPGIGYVVRSGDGFAYVPSEL